MVNVRKHALLVLGTLTDDRHTFMRVGAQIYQTEDSLEMLEALAAVATQERRDRGIPCEAPAARTPTEGGLPIAS